MSLIDGTPRDMWDLIGTNEQMPRLRSDWAVPLVVGVAAVAANGSESQKWNIDDEKGLVVNRSTGKVLDLSGTDGTTVLAFSPNGRPNQEWRMIDGSIENPAKRRRLDICGGIGGIRIVGHAPNGGENQMWRYDRSTGEVVNPASRKVLDMHGAVTIPEDIQEMLRLRAGKVDHVFVQLLEA